MSVIRGAHNRIRLNSSYINTDTIKSITGTEPQRLFWDNASKYRAFVGGIGSGKTYAGAAECFRQAPRTVGMVLAPTYRMLEDATIPALKEIGHKYMDGSQRHLIPNEKIGYSTYSVKIQQD
jgi:cysteine synthase